MSGNVKVEQRPRVLYYGPHHGGAEPRRREGGRLGYANAGAPGSGARLLVIVLRMDKFRAGDAFAALSDAILEFLQAKMASISRGPSTSTKQESKTDSGQWKTDIGAESEFLETKRRE